MWLISPQRTLAEQSTHHLTLNAQLAASQAQQSALQFEIERATLAVSAMKAELEVGRQRAREAEDRAEQKITDAENQRDARIAEIEDDLRAAETIRRKLHNQVQELKGWPSTYKRTHKLNWIQAISESSLVSVRHCVSTSRPHIMGTLIQAQRMSLIHPTGLRTLSTATSVRTPKMDKVSSL